MNFELLSALAPIVALVLLDVLALRFGADSRTRLDPKISPPRDV